MPARLGYATTMSDFEPVDFMLPISGASRHRLLSLRGGRVNSIDYLGEVVTALVELEAEVEKLKMRVAELESQAAQ